MKISLKVISCLMTASFSFFRVTGNTERPVNNNCDKTYLQFTFSNSVAGTNKPVNYTGYVGGSFTIECKYPGTQKSRIKRFCKDSGNVHCSDLISTDTSNETKRGRFSLTDDKQREVYTVIISTLTREDAGKHWCAMEKIKESYIACLTEIHLHILNWDDVTTMHVTYPASKTAVITCNYSLAIADNEKFLCKGENPLDCKELIHTTERAVKGKFDIKDNKRLRYFNVHIANLGSDDSGTYWCGSGRTEQRDQYTKIHLSVAETHVRTKKSDAKPRQRKESQQELSKEDSNEKRNGESNEERDEDSNEKRNGESNEERNGESNEEHDGESNEERDGEPNKKPNVGLIAGIVVGLAVVMAVVIVLILYKRPPACCAAGGSSEQSKNTGHHTEGNIGDHQYEEINLQNQPASSLPSVYATVNGPVDPLHYASVNFQKDRNAPPDANKSGDSALVIGRAPGDGQSAAAAETSLYSTVSTPGPQ